MTTSGVSWTRSEGGDGEDAVVRGDHIVERRPHASPHVVDAILPDKGLYTQLRPVIVEVASGKLRSSVDSTLIAISPSQPLR